MIEQLRVPGYPAKVERAILFHVEAYSENCPQYITIRYSEAEVAEIIAPLPARIAELEQQLGITSSSSIFPKSCCDAKFRFFIITYASTRSYSAGLTLS